MARNLPACYSLLMDDKAIRRAWWRAGCDVKAAASALGLSRPTVYRALKRAHEAAPVTLGISYAKDAEVDAEDRDAITAYLALTLRERAGVRKPE